MDIRLPIPQNWQDFESICHRLWQEIWNDPNAQKNGRVGQPQSGVDIFGQPSYSNKLSGVQCKDKDCQLGSKLKADDLYDECNKAKLFRPDLEEFTLATTSARDAKLQELAREITNKDKFPFKVNVWSWNDIEDEIQYRSAILDNYYSDFKTDYDLQKSICLNKFNTKDFLRAYFTRPLIADDKISDIKDLLIPLIYELSDNAYKHGDATNFSLKLDNDTLTLKDNGIKFNPKRNLDHTKVSKNGYVGSYVFKTFTDELGKAVKISYFYEDKSKENIIKLKFDKHLLNLKKGRLEANIDINDVSGRVAIARLADSLDVNSNIKELVINVCSVYNPSAFVQFLVIILHKLKKDQKVKIFVPRNSYLGEVADWIKDERLSIISR